MDYIKNQFSDFLSYRSLMYIVNTEQYADSNLEMPEQVSNHQFIGPLVIRNKWGIVTIIKGSTKVSIYPNRIIDQAILEFKCIAHYPVKIEIAEISGKVLDKTVFYEKSKKDLDLSIISAGLYELKVADSAELRATIRFIKYRN